MIWEAWATLAVVGGILAVLIATRIGTDLVMMGGLTLLLLLGVIGPEQAFSGAANPGVLAVAVLFAVAAGMRETGAIHMLLEPLLGRPRGVREAQARVIAPVAALSALLNNTPIVAMMVPLVSDWARKHQIALSKVLIPISYASILGGATTLIGTSTNLVVNGLLIAQTEHKGLGIFDISVIGLPCAVIGIVYLLLAAKWLLPDRQPPISFEDDPREYTIEMMVPEGSPLAGKTVEDAGLRQLPGMFLIEIDREGNVIPAVSSTEVLRANDRLVFAGVVESVVDLQKTRGLVPATEQVFKLDSPREQRCLVETVISNSFPLAGRTIREAQFRKVYNAAIIAVARQGKRINRKIGDITLQAGDTLLLETQPSFVDQHRNSRDFFLVSRLENSTPPQHDRAWLALGILALLIGLVSTGIASMLTGALLAVGLLIGTRCLTGPIARRSIDWQVLVAIIAAFGIGQAMDVSGAADGVARSLLGFAGENPWLMLAIVYGVTMIFTELITNNAAAVLMFPIALAVSGTLGVNYLPYVIAVMMAASFGFATPIGYQTNLMVYGPGGYRFTDYLRVGIPLDLLLWATAVTLIPIFFPF